MAVDGCRDFTPAASNAPHGAPQVNLCTMSIVELVALGMLIGLGAGLLAGLVGIGGRVVI